MATTIMDEIRESFKKGNALTKLIYINLGVFLVVKIVYVFFFLSVSQQTIPYGFTKESYFTNEILSYLMIPSNLSTLTLRPWTPFTYMFLHFGIIHILFNLLVLFWFGRIFLRYLTEKQLMTTYILGGLCGAILFVASYNILPGLSDGIALGASAAVMAIAIAISFYTPDYQVYIPFIGPTKLKYIAIFYIVLDILQIASANAGGHIAHLGGAIYGYMFATQLHRGKDTGKSFSKMLDSIITVFKRKPKLKVTYKSQAQNLTDEEYNMSKAKTQKEIDRILDKIAKSGYDALTKKEKETLFKMSK